LTLVVAAEAFLLAALWGASFLFMRVGVAEFGAAPLMAVRVGVAALCLLPLLMLKGGLPNLRTHYRALGIVGVTNSAIPFTLLTFSTLYLSAGFTAILNATVPFWSAVIAYFWLAERLSALRIFGLLVGTFGVAVLVWGKLSFEFGGAGWAILAALVACGFYGFGANFARRYLSGVDSLTIATGSMLGACFLMLPLAFWFWPSDAPSAKAWMLAIVMGVACTALAYILYFRLIARLGATYASTVTFLIPAFAMLWGAVLLDESISPEMLAGTALILLGTSLSLGLIGRHKRT
jgi:drug/metabolite transporter (DMT)-like permease